MTFLEALHNVFHLNVLQPLGQLVIAASADMDVEPDVTKPYHYGHWYLKPHRHGFELIALAAASGLAVFSTSRSALRFRPPPNPPPASRVFKFFKCLSFASFGLLSIHKRLRNMEIFMLSPCHITLATFCAVMVMSPKKPVAGWILNVNMYNVWGTVLALAQPDLRECDMFLEKENFWLEHCLLLILPAYLAGTGRYTLTKPSMRMAFCSFAFKMAYHMWVLSPTALATGANLNYMLVPPPGPLEAFGKYYRLVMVISCLVVTHVTRYFYVTPVMKLLELGRPNFASPQPDRGGKQDISSMVNIVGNGGGAGLSRDDTYPHPTGNWTTLAAELTYRMPWSRLWARLRKDSAVDASSKNGTLH